MTKEQFKAEWEKDDCKITFDDIAKCAVEWEYHQILKYEIFMIFVTKY